ncbi:DUF2793 domain-containing protein [Thioclava sp. FR2]|uniref:DUF2793 domain-containing protein n=1 Tax=Thioclava sp. FR2 TaxID=3445780 RepID=UPI003EB9A621
MPNDSTAILSLPYILPAQAQKHITHNEALRLLDILVQLVVLSRQLTSPPISPADGDCYLVPSGALDGFAAHEGQIACWEGTGWAFITPRPGWHAEILDENCRAVFDGVTWVGTEASSLRVAELGVSTDADSLNRLAVSSAASLFTHSGAGHQVKINKATATDTASLLFQTGWSGRAEMGTAGSDNFEIKTSSNGSSFQTSLRALSSSGKVELPLGASLASGNANQPTVSFLNDLDTGIFSPDADQIGLATGGFVRAVLSGAALNLSVPLTGSAVTQSNTDQSAGRLIKVGDFGLGSAITLTSADDLNNLSAAGMYFNPTGGNTPGNNYPISSAGALLNIRRSATNWVQQYVSYAGASLATDLRVFIRSYGGSGWSPWVEQFHQGTIVRPVSQSAGVPTGGVIERGSNANGEYVRFADGTQICTLRTTISLAISTAFLGGFRSAAQTWVFPAAFIGTSLPVITLTPESASAFAGVMTAAPTSATASWAVTSVVSQTAANRMVSMTATGRWF